MSTTETIPVAMIAAVSLTPEGKVLLALDVEKTKVVFELTTPAVAILALTLHPTLSALKAKLPPETRPEVPNSPEGL